MSKLASDLKDFGFRHAYANSFLDSSLAAQIRALREQRGLSQEQLARKMRTGQAAISRAENVNYGRWSLDSLRSFAEAFDLRLKVSFESFDSLPGEVDRFSRKLLER